ncbi:hypothetical protein D477_003123 [Arthrobacter crystallopoietes BAB-32]|uniref:DUF4352 domain-containing protein n=1 Tax=Arthrobacter crystallopoietes BAB-32 TaxID=1246476 RepID=N1VBH8_9MICC|nr:hypothetical protein [Arthrobacter crystallopoietes]EMY35653.1 hypothetical protein D477_003123 [Arthrobacter crystallopoietes BAB-32]
MKKSIALTVALLAGLGLSACSSPAPTVEPQSETTAAAEETTAAAAPAETAEEPSQEAAPADRSAKFGDKVTFENGVEVTVTAKGLQPAGQYAYGAVENQIAVFDIEVTNGGQEEFEAILMGVPEVKYGDKGKGAEHANDSENNIGIDQFSTVLPGETQTVTVGYGIPEAEADNVRVEVTAPNFMDKPAIFKGSIK